MRAFELRIFTAMGLITPVVFADSKRQALRMADKFALDQRILRRQAQEIFG
jgi:hypothetical protein